MTEGQRNAAADLDNIMTQSFRRFKVHYDTWGAIVATGFTASVEFSTRFTDQADVITRAPAMYAFTHTSDG